MDELIESLRKLGPAKLATIGGVGLALLGFFAFVLARMTGSEMVVLYTDLMAGDATAVSQRLDTLGANYHLSPDGGTILVPEQLVGELRMTLAQEGLPSGGNLAGYELFDKSDGFGTTQFVQDIKKVRALEGELARTIGALEPVRSARVHLVLPTRELFSREEQPASASVLIRLRPNSSLTGQQVQAVQHLIAAAVPKLEANAVSISDDSGNLLARGGEVDDDVYLAQQNDELTRNVEKRLTGQIVEVLAPTLGWDNVIARVTAELDFDRIARQSTSYDPDQQVTISSVLSESSRESSDGGIAAVSVGNNLPGGEDAGGTGGGTADREEAITETTNYEVGRTVTTEERAVGQVRRLSVAVVVNGVWERNEEGELVYTPRSEQEIEEIEALVRSAVGIDENRGDQVRVTHMQFAGGPPPIVEFEDNLIMGFEREELLDITETFVMALVGILVIVMVIRPVVMRLLPERKEKAQDEEDGEGLEGAVQQLIPGPDGMPVPALPGPNGGLVPIGPDGQPLQMVDGDDERMIDLKQVEGKVKESSLKKIAEIVDKHPQESLSVLRSWIYQES